MIRFLVLYPEPPDAAAFDDHYFQTHVPLAKQLPGLRNYRIGRHTSVIRGEKPYYLVGELDWDDQASLQADFASPLGRQLAQDVDKLSELCPGIQSIVYELETL